MGVAAKIIDKKEEKPADDYEIYAEIYARKWLEKVISELQKEN